MRRERLDSAFMLLLNCLLFMLSIEIINPLKKIEEKNPHISH